jgi:predicted Zn-dependent protease with MMP-like domain
MDQTAPTCDDIAEIARQTVSALPEKFRDAAGVVVVQVTDFVDDALAAELEVDPFELTGLYEGIPLTEKSSMDQPHGPDIVRLFRRPILDEWAGRGDVTVAELVTHVTVHEFAHHFGWTDEDIARIDEWWA